MSKADTAFTTTRRALALGAGAFASTGLTAGAAATVAGGAHAELLRLSAVVLRTDAASDAMYSPLADTMGGPSEEQWAQIHALVAEGHAAAEQLADLRAASCCAACNTCRG